MFPLRDRTRRRITLAAFVVLCLVPTVAVLAYGVRQHLPGYAVAEADRLGRSLGLDISIDSVDHLRPRSIRYEGIVASDTETGRELFRCQSLEVSWKQATQDNGRPHASLTLIASGTELEAGAFEELWGLLDRLFRRQTGWPDFDASLSIGVLTLLSNAEPTYTLSETQVRIKTDATGAQAKFTFHPAESLPGEPVSLQIARDCRKSAPVANFSLSTGPSGLPCSLMSVGMKGLDVLGPESRFHGDLGANETPEGWSGRIEGHFTNAQLEELIMGRNIPNHVGTSRWTVDRAQHKAGHLETEARFFSAGPGQMGRSLLESLVPTL